MRQYIIAIATALFCLSTPATLWGQDGKAHGERAAAALKEATTAVTAGDYKTGCAKSSESIRETELFLAYFRSVVANAQSNTDTDPELLARARSTLANLETSHQKNREMNIKICDMAGMPPQS